MTRDVFGHLWAEAQLALGAFGDKQVSGLSQRQLTAATDRRSYGLVHRVSALLQVWAEARLSRMVVLDPTA